MMSNKLAIAEKRQPLAEAIQTPARATDWTELSHAIGLPEVGFLRLDDIVGKAATKTSPAIPAIIPISKSTWWKGVRSGRFPQPTRQLGARITAWSVESIRTLIEKTSVREAS
jgi:predicted DNA-binding transcriptional regulator AlpA